MLEENPPDTAEPSANELDALEVGAVQTRAGFNLDPAQSDAEAFAPVLDAQQRLVGIVSVTEHIDRVYARLTRNARA